jgi:hypothetical protein
MTLTPPPQEGRESISLVFTIPDHPWVDGTAVRIAMTVAEAGEQEGVLQTVRAMVWNLTGRGVFCSRSAVYSPCSSTRTPVRRASPHHPRLQRALPDRSRSRTFSTADDVSSRSGGEEQSSPPDPKMSNPELVAEASAAPD